LSGWLPTRPSEPYIRNPRGPVAQRLDPHGVGDCRFGSLTVLLRYRCGIPPSSVVRRVLRVGRGRRRQSILVPKQFDHADRVIILHEVGVAVVRVTGQAAA
jgi:hypothetical protein